MRQHGDHNVGGNDRIARLPVGTALLVVGIAGIAGGTTLAAGLIALVAAAAVLPLVGAVLVVTGYRRQGPINSRPGVDTLTAAVSSGWPDGRPEPDSF